MSTYYYNPATREAHVNQTVSTIPATDTFYAFNAKLATKAHTIYTDPFKHIEVQVDSLQDMLHAMELCNFSGHEDFLDEDGTLYSIYQEGSWAYQPLTEDGLTSPGINWGTQWFLTKEAADAFCCELSDKCLRYDDPEYHEDLDTWSVHYHYYVD